MKKMLSLLVALLLCMAALPAMATDEAPQRIVSQPVWSTEILLEMVGPERLIGISSYCDNPAVTYVAEESTSVGIIGGADGPTAIYVTEGASAAQVPNRVSSNNAEGILTLSPDLVVMDTFSDWDGALTQTLKDAGINVVQLESPTDFEAVMHRITDLGEVTGEAKQADIMVEAISDRLNAVAKKLQGLTDAERVPVMYYEDMYDATGNSAGLLCAYGPGSTFDAIAAAAGCLNVCDAENYSPISKETLLVEWKPEMLIVSSSYMDENYVMHADGGEQLIAAILADDTLQELPAVKDGKVYAIDDRARSSTSQYMVLAVEELAKLAYPDRF